MNRKAVNSYADCHSQCGLLPGRLCRVGFFSEYLLSSAGLNDMGATLAVITMGAFIMYQLRGKKKK